MSLFPTVIDSSMLGSFKSCPQLFKKQYIDEWKPKQKSVHLHAGGAFAKGIEAARLAYFVEGAPFDDAVAIGLGALLKAYGDFECPEDSAKSSARMSGALEFYFANYPMGGDGTEPVTLASGRRGIEFSFVQPIPITNPSTGDPLLYSGRMDAILSYAGGQYVTDEKTTSYLGAQWSRQWDLRSQFSGYCWGCRENGIRVDGVLVRGVSILKTKYDTQQALSPRTPYMIEQWYSEMLEWVRDIIVCWERGVWKHNFDHACTEYGGCGFRRCCASQDETPWLETEFERRHWNPILGTETKL